MHRNEAAPHQDFYFHQMGLPTGGILPRNQFAGRNFEWAETLPPGCVEKLALYESMESWIYDACNLVQHVCFFWLDSLRFGSVDMFNM